MDIFHHTMTDFVLNKKPLYKKKLVYRPMCEWIYMYRYNITIITHYTYMM